MSLYTLPPLVPVLPPSAGTRCWLTAAVSYFSTLSRSSVTTPAGTTPILLYFCTTAPLHMLDPSIYRPLPPTLATSARRRCIPARPQLLAPNHTHYTHADYYTCLLYTSDAADEEDSVDLGGRRIIKKKKKR
eukprot:TRINITY_DN497_c0_g1_i5.p1 TRINITY_DN497_c0_g1~~TRINITY_DN497_c0_g1_i5.p1  ORF type:complete len:132 (+),score=7.98 TRINITY_DN497_c0_g1_i5:108-503(+)